MQIMRFFAVFGPSMVSNWSDYDNFYITSPHRNLGSRSLEFMIKFPYIFYGQLPIVSILMFIFPKHYDQLTIILIGYVLQRFYQFLWATDHSFQKLTKQNLNHKTQTRSEPK